jgi:hypothetical protein
MTGPGQGGAIRSGPAHFELCAFDLFFDPSPREYIALAGRKALLLFSGRKKQIGDKPKRNLKPRAGLES